LPEGDTGDDPELTLELVAGGTVLESITMNAIPKNTDDSDDTNDWYERKAVFNPGANTLVDIVIRTNSNKLQGNDLLLDDILAYQQPIQCGIEKCHSVDHTRSCCRYLHHNNYQSRGC